MTRSIRLRALRRRLWLRRSLRVATFAAAAAIGGNGAHPARRADRRARDRSVADGRCGGGCAAGVGGHLVAQTPVADRCGARRRRGARPARAPGHRPGADRRSASGRSARRGARGAPTGRRPRPPGERRPARRLPTAPRPTPLGRRRDRAGAAAGADRVAEPAGRRPSRPRGSTQREPQRGGADRGGCQGGRAAGEHARSGAGRAARAAPAPGAPAPRGRRRRAGRAGQDRIGPGAAVTPDRSAGRDEGRGPDPARPADLQGGHRQGGRQPRGRPGARRRRTSST